MKNLGRTMLTFSVSSYVLLTQLGQEFACHEDVTADSSFDGETFTLAIECADTAAMVWEVRVLVLTFDKESAFCHATNHFSGGTYDRPAA